jgi:DNA-binding NtrC family response regulator
VNVVHFALPPLRARVGDVAVLMNAFLEEFAAKAHRPPPRVTAEAWAVLERHTWPGNARELRNVAQRLVVLDDDGSVSAEDLSGVLRHVSSSSDGKAAVWPTSYAEAQNRALRSFRGSFVTQLLDQHGGNVSRAAAAAGVSRRTFHRWLADMNASDPGEQTG